MTNDTTTTDEPGQELEVAGTVEYETTRELTVAPVRTMDMRDRVTDSWTDVLTEVGQLAQAINGTELVPDALRGRPGAVGGVILKGRELGLPPMTALGSVFSIKGQLGMKAETMRALIMQRGHEIVVEETSSAICVMSGRRKGSERWTKVTWTREDARQAGTKNMDRFPRQMLQARCTTELARLVFPDVIAGLRSVEEIEADLEDVPALPPGQVVTGPSTKVKRAPRAKAAKKAAAPAPEPELPGDEPAPAPAPEPERTLTVVKDDDEGPAVAAPEPELPEPVTSSAETVTSERGANRGQVGIIAQHAQRLGFDRDEKLKIVEAILLRPIETTNDLTAREATAVIKALESYRTFDDLIAALAAADGDKA